ncbi:hypothetical protein KM043_012364 [Ampulex compressa]|nr:hypothetical protein KM043_012364 [Ampulex compressa]
MDRVKDLKLIGAIAFDGSTRDGLRVHPDGKCMVYPMGNRIIIRDIDSGECTFLTGHRDTISALCVSTCGRFLASGQTNHFGFKAKVILWEYERRTVRASHEIHKVRVEDVRFSCDSSYLFSLGGRDDGNVVVWDVRANAPICGTFAGSEISGWPLRIAPARSCSRSFVSAGKETLRVWRIDVERRKVYGCNVKVGKLRRIINCVAIDGKDERAYCGTSSGDILEARLNFSQNFGGIDEAGSFVMIGCYSKVSRPKRAKTAEVGLLYSGGVKSLLLLEAGRAVVGAGDGTVELVEIPSASAGTSKTSILPTTPRIIAHRRATVCNAVTSLDLLRTDSIFVGTSACEIYQIDLSTFAVRLLVTCHTTSIRAIAFPRKSSEFFATGSENDIRLWGLRTQKELLRINVTNFVCTDLCFTHDDRMIISGWNDGVIRAFASAGGNERYVICNAHRKSVSAVAVTTDGRRCISGGCDGQVRVWAADSQLRRLISVLKEHRGPITSLDVSHDDTILLSSSLDGTCVLWDLMQYARKHVITGNTMYMTALFTPDNLQVLTCGTDRKIAYWEVWNCSLIREIEGSTAGTINSMDFNVNGRYFVTGSNDFAVKLWEYRTGSMVAIGLTHAGTITGCRFSPDGRHIVTVAADGSIAIWKSPSEVYESIDDAR